MANKHRGEVEIQLDRLRVLKCNHYAIAKIEEAVGMPVNAWPNPGSPFSLGIRGYIATLYALLLHQDKKMTFERAAEFLDEFDADMICDKLVLAYFGKSAAEIEEMVKEQTEEPDPNLQAATGSEIAPSSPQTSV